MAKTKVFSFKVLRRNFRYYHEGAIRVEANMDGVPIYIDGKYIGDTPLRKPVNVERMASGKRVFSSIHAPS